MNKALLASAASAAALALVPAFAQAPTPAGTRAHGGQAHSRAEVAQRIQARFVKMDADRNGWLTDSEAEAVRGERAGKRADRRADKRFDRLDSNNDNAVSRAELDAAQAKGSERVAERGGRRAGARTSGGGMFGRSDLNKDGRVSLQEATNAALQHFDMADANRDGQVTREERSEMRKKMRAERGRG